MRYELRNLCFALILVVIVSPAPTAGVTPRDAASDRHALIAIENDWLDARDAATLDHILASDFIHPIAQGFFLTKAGHIGWFSKHPPPANRKERIDQIQVRLYGNVGIVNGIVIASDEHGKEIDRTIFTDIFVYRDGRWQAVNAQENRVGARR